MAEQDELLAAEEEYQRQAKRRLNSEDGWAEAQPDAGLPSNARTDDAASKEQGVAEEGAGGGAKKKPRLSEEDKKRGNRMFGAMMGTLSRFKDDTAKTRQTEAAKRRQEVEKRLQQKLKAESEALQKKRDLELEEKSLRQNVNRKAEEIGSLNEIYAVRHKAKLSLANYLCTSPRQPPAADRYHAASILPSHPHSLPVGSAITQRSGVAGAGGQRPIYWLPVKLTRDQKDQIERQKKEARDAVGAQEDDWRDEKEERQAKLDQDRAHRDSRLNEIQAERHSSIRDRPRSPSSSSIRQRRPSPDVKRPSPEPAPQRDEDEGDVRMSKREEDEERERSENVEMEDAGLASAGRGDEDAVEY